MVSNVMLHSTLTDAFQTPLPREVVDALGLQPGQRITYQILADGSATIRPAVGVDVLFGSVKLKRKVASPRQEKRAARKAIATKNQS